MRIDTSQTDDASLLAAEVRRLAAALDDATGEVARLREAIRRLAEQDATLSVCEGNVTVTADGTLTDAERKAVEWAIEVADSLAECSGAGTGGEPSREAATLRGLLARLGGAS